MANNTNLNTGGNTANSTNPNSPTGQEQSMNNENFSVPGGIGFEAYSGSLQEILRDNIGKYVEIEFLIGSTSLQTRSGILYAVGTSYVVINQLPEKMVCDIYSIKFVTFRNAATQNEVRQLIQNSQQNSGRQNRSRSSYRTESTAIF